LDARDVLFAHGDVVLEVEIVKHGTEGERLGFFEECEAFEVLTVVLVLAQEGKGLKEGLEDALLRGA